MNVQLPEALREHLQGASYRAIARRRGVAHETARKLVIAQERQIVGCTAYDLYAAWKAEADGKIGGWPTLLVPHGPDHQVAQAFVTWLIGRLNDLRLPLKVVHRPTQSGNVYMLTLDADELDRRNGLKENTE